MLLLMSWQLDWLVVVRVIVCNISLNQCFTVCICLTQDFNFLSVLISLPCINYTHTNYTYTTQRLMNFVKFNTATFPNERLSQVTKSRKSFCIFAKSSWELTFTKLSKILRNMAQIITSSSQEKVQLFTTFSNYYYRTWNDIHVDQ